MKAVLRLIGGYDNRRALQLPPSRRQNQIFAAQILPLRRAAATTGNRSCGLHDAGIELGMDLANIKDAKEWFEVLQTSDRSQTAVMTLKPGKSSGAKEGHKNSDQVLLLLEGELEGEIGDEKAKLKKGDVLLISAGVKHRFTNRSAKSAVTFNVYAPPEYPAKTEGWRISEGHASACPGRAEAHPSALRDRRRRAHVDRARVLDSMHSRLSCRAESRHLSLPLA